MALVTEEQLAVLITRGGVRDIGELLDLPPVAKLHTPAAGATWLIAAIDPHDHDRAWGLCDPGMGSPELGWVSLVELDRLHDRFDVLVCRDQGFEAKASLRTYAVIAASLGVIVA